MARRMENRYLRLKFKIGSRGDSEDFPRFPRNIADVVGNSSTPRARPVFGSHARHGPAECRIISGPRGIVGNSATNGESPQTSPGNSEKRREARKPPDRPSRRPDRELKSVSYAHAKFPGARCGPTALQFSWGP